jgi:dihydroorotate dehydrogenase (fumarate)
LKTPGHPPIVLHSLFEEQIRRERMEIHHHTDFGTDSYAEALTYFPEPDRSSTWVPKPIWSTSARPRPWSMCPSSPASTAPPWGAGSTTPARSKQAGADALELNIYWIPTDMECVRGRCGAAYLDIVKAVRGGGQIPLAVKLSPYFSNTANMAKQLCSPGSDGLVLFNRFYQPDIDIEELEIQPNLMLSAPQDQRLPLTWIALLYGQGGCSLAATTGINRLRTSSKC